MKRKAKKAATPSKVAKAKASSKKASVKKPAAAKKPTLKKGSDRTRLALMSAGVDGMVTHPLPQIPSNISELFDHKVKCSKPATLIVNGTAWAVKTDAKGTVYTRIAEQGKLVKGSIEVLKKLTKKIEVLSATQVKAAYASSKQDETFTLTESKEKLTGRIIAEGSKGKANYTVVAVPEKGGKFRLVSREPKANIHNSRHRYVSESATAAEKAA